MTDLILDALRIIFHMKRLSSSSARLKENNHFKTSHSFAMAYEIILERVHRMLLSTYFTFNSSLLYQVDWNGRLIEKATYIYKPSKTVLEIQYWTLFITFLTLSHFLPKLDVNGWLLFNRHTLLNGPEQSLSCITERITAVTEDILFNPNRRLFLLHHMLLIWTKCTWYRIKRGHSGFGRGWAKSS